jgi:hypothetical protein
MSSSLFTWMTLCLYQDGFGCLYQYSSALTYTVELHFLDPKKEGYDSDDSPLSSKFKIIFNGKETCIEQR